MPLLVLALLKKVFLMELTKVTMKMTVMMKLKS